MKRLRAVVLLLPLACLPAAAQAEPDVPSSLLLYGTEENDHLQADCSPQGGSLHCRFIEVQVSHAYVETDEEYAERLDGIVEEFLSPKGQQEREAMCRMLPVAATALQTGETPDEWPPGIDPKEFLAGLRKMTAQQRQDQLDQLSPLLGVCENPTREAVVAMTEAERELKRKTCKVWVNEFEQTFEPTGSGQWLSKSSPLVNECGIVNISVLERPADHGKDHWWVYRTRKVVTNPDGAVLGLRSCSELDTREFFYDWKPAGPAYMNCQYIKFGF